MIHALNKSLFILTYNFICAILMGKLITTWFLITLNVIKILNNYSITEKKLRKFKQQPRLTNVYYEQELKKNRFHLS